MMRVFRNRTSSCTNIFSLTITGLKDTNVSLLLCGTGPRRELIFCPGCLDGSEHWAGLLSEPGRVRELLPRTAGKCLDHWWRFRGRFELMVATQGDGPFDQCFHKHGKALFAQLIGKRFVGNLMSVRQLQSIEMTV
jgi:hypothetical protein